MKVRPSSVKRNVFLLTDPTPTHLSDVDHGANQAPWKTVKSHTGEGSNMVIKTQATKQPIVRALTLSKDVFKTEKSAIDYLQSKKWDPESYELFDDEDNGEYIARSTDEYGEGEISKSRSVPSKDAGVFMQVAEILKAKKPSATDMTDMAQPLQDNTSPGIDAQGNAIATPNGDDDEVNQTVTTEDLPHNPAAGVQRGKGGTDDEPEDPNAGDTDDSGDIPADVKKPTAKKLAKVRRVSITDQGDSANVAKTATTGERILAFRGELAQKYDWWSAYSSKSTSLSGIIKDGMGYDNLPPGIDTIMDAVYNTAGNIFGDSNVADKKAALKALGDDFAEISVGLYDLFTKAATDLGDDSAQKFATSFAASIKASKTHAISIAKIAGTEKPVAKADGEVVETEEVDISELISRSVRTAMAPLTTEIKAVTARIDSTASEVQKLSVRQPTAKGMADVFEDEVDHDAVKRASADAAARTEMMRSAMGLRRPVTAR